MVQSTSAIMSVCIDSTLCLTNLVEVSENDMCLRNTNWLLAVSGAILATLAVVTMAGEKKVESVLGCSQEEEKMRMRKEKNSNK